MTQNQIVQIADSVRQDFNLRTKSRDLALSQTRLLTRHCANAIRAIHRDEKSVAEEHLGAAQNLIVQLKHDLSEYPDLYFAGYTQDALKEFAEAKLFFSLINNLDLPTPEELGMEASTYMQGIAEAVGELRRRCLDQLRLGNSTEADRLLSLMDEIYTELITMDYPDAITRGLRRLTDIARSILERTRGDLTLTLRQEHLEKLLRRTEERLMKF
jgi:translin